MRHSRILFAQTSFVLLAGGVLWAGSSGPGGAATVSRHVSLQADPGGIRFQAAPGTPAKECSVNGRATSSGIPLPGVAVIATRDGQVVSATSTDLTGAYRLRLPAGDFVVSAELAAFARVERTLSVPGESCQASLDIELVLASRAQAAEPSGPGPIVETPSSLRRPNRLGAGTTSQQTGQPRFSQLQVVQANGAGAASTSSGSIDDADPATRLLPPGFSTDAATSVVAVTGDAVNLDRGQLRDRLDALGRGEFEAAGVQPPDGFGGRFGGPGGPGGFPGGAGAIAGAPGFAGGQGPPLPGGPGGPGGFGGGRGGFFPGRGRGNTIQGSVNYTFGGSALDAAPYPLRANSQTDPDYTRQQFGATFGGPLRIPGVYSGSRTTFFLNYAGGRSSNLVDQYATVPTESMRAGDFSSLAIGPTDPTTGLPFAGGQIPQSRLDPSALALLRFIPSPNLAGVTQNYRRSVDAPTSNDGFSLRVTHNFSGAPGRGGPGARGGFGRGGGLGRGGGRGGRSGTAVVLNAQFQYRRNDTGIVNVFPLLGGTNLGSSLSAPVTLNILHNRSIHNIQVTATRTKSSARNAFTGVVDVAGNAGITGVATSPFEWGVPSVSFTSFTGLNDVAPTVRTDRRLQLGYTFTHPFRAHTFRAGADARLDDSSGISNTDARGTFVFTGLYSASGAVRSSGLDFADFLLGLPQQATVQYTDDAALRGRSFNLFAQDDWRLRSNLTLNLGVRYELVRPYTEARDRMVNLDVTPDFTAAEPVLAGATGAFTGPFPSSLVNTDYNNLAPRVGVAWRASQRTIVRGGFGTSFNNGSYAAIARQLIAQPPFAVTNTSIGSLADPLALSDPFAEVDSSTTTNNFGIDKNYQLGVIQTWNVDVNRNAGRGWQFGAGYTGTRGTHLDVLRAPNRDPDGLRIEGVQAFLWESAEGESILHAATFRLRKQQTRGIGGSLNYTLAKSRDDASSIGGGGRVVAQDDRNLEAEWGTSSFDRRHQLTGNLLFELPFGPNRHWLTQDGAWTAALRDWTLSASFSALSGTPFTARLVGATSDVARGTNGTLRADYTGAQISINDPTLLRFFNTSAFAIPAPGTFGSAQRNTIVGPGTQEVDASINRDVRLSGNQVVSIQLQATNLFNTVRFGAIDSVVNSPTFGQVVSIRPMRTVQLGVRFRF